MNALPTLSKPERATLARFADDARAAQIAIRHSPTGNAVKAALAAIKDRKADR